MNRDPHFLFTTFPTNDFIQDYSYRYKLDYNHTFNFADEEKKRKGLNTTLGYTVKKTGRNKIEENNDPFFGYDLERRNPRQFEFSDLYLNPDLNEQPRGTDLKSKTKETDDINFEFKQDVSRHHFESKRRLGFSSRRSGCRVRRR